MNEMNELRNEKKCFKKLKNMIDNGWAIFQEIKRNSDAIIYNFIIC